MTHYMNYFGGNANTERAKRAVLGQFAAFVERSVPSPTLAHVVRTAIEDWKEELLEEGLSAATVAQRLAIVKHFCRMSAQLFPGWQDPSFGIAAPTPPKRAPKWLTSAELNAVRAYVRSQVKEGFLRARALVITELGFGLGLRRFEISALALCSLDLQRGLILNFRRKGTKFCDKPLTHKALEAIARYLPLRDAEICHYWPGHSKLSARTKALYPLIVSHWSAWPHKPTSWQMDAGTINRMTKEIGQAAGVEHLNAHRMRHTFCRRLWERTRDLELTMHGADHTNANTTMRYIGSTDEQLREAMEDDD